MLFLIPRAHQIGQALESVQASKFRDSHSQSRCWYGIADYSGARTFESFVPSVKTQACTVTFDKNMKIPGELNRERKGSSPEDLARVASFAAWRRRGRPPSSAASPSGSARSVPRKN
eukprot:6189887-Pleurochrysis_carterae.AAC.9